MWSTRNNQFLDRHGTYTEILLLMFVCMFVSSEGTGNVLKIQHLLHTCSEYHSNKEEEGVASEDATDSEAAKDGASNGAASGGSGSGSGDAAKTKKAESTTKETTAKKVTTSGAAKDVEMKDAEAAEAGSLSEPGAHQAISVLGIALIAMGEDIGAEMALRTFNHLVRGPHIY